MSKIEYNPEMDDEIRSFLVQWFSGLLEGIEKVNNETWPLILEMTGRACAKVHSTDLFKKIWAISDDIDDFINKINKELDTITFKRNSKNEISVHYSKCSCPLVLYGLVNSPIMCNCSPNWIIENFETILNIPISVKTEQTILRGAKSCKFTISLNE